MKNVQFHDSETDLHWKRSERSMREKVTLYKDVQFHSTVVGY